MKRLILVAFFLLTLVSCSIAGHSHDEAAPLSACQTHWVDGVVDLRSCLKWEGTLFIPMGTGNNDNAEGWCVCPEDVDRFWLGGPALSCEEK